MVINSGYLFDMDSTHATKLPELMCNLKEEQSNDAYAIFALDHIAAFKTRPDAIFIIVAGP